MSSFTLTGAVATPLACPLTVSGFRLLLTKYIHLILIAVKLGRNNVLKRCFLPNLKDWVSTAKAEER